LSNLAVLSSKAAFILCREQHLDGVDAIHRSLLQNADCQDSHGGGRHLAGLLFVIRAVAFPGRAKRPTGSGVKQQALAGLQEPAKRRCVCIDVANRTGAGAGIVGASMLIIAHLLDDATKPGSGHSPCVKPELF
jgi:hypothetical protein